MSSLANVKSHLAELEDQKSKLETEIQNAKRLFRLSLWGIGIGILLLPLAWLMGLPVIVIAGIVALVYSIKQASFNDKLESVETEIHKLEISMV